MHFLVSYFFKIHLQGRDGGGGAAHPKYFLGWVGASWPAIFFGEDFISEIFFGEGFISEIFFKKI
jgi:hypothetical protein